MKYNYDKKLMKQFSVGPFLGQVKLREKMLSQAPDTPPVSVFNANILAKKLHPHAQYAIISKVRGPALYLGAPLLCSVGDHEFAPADTR